MSEEQQEQQQEEQQQEQQQEQKAEKPEWADERFWDAEKGELRVEDVHKSWKHANDKLSGKKNAPEAYELGFSEDFDKEMLEGLDADNPLIKNMMEIAKENDVGQEGFNKLLNAFIASELEDEKAVEEYKAAQMAELGENGKQRIKDVQLWLDATLDKETAEGLKGALSTAKAVEALEKLKEAVRTPSLKVDDEITGEMVATHEEIRKRQFAKDEHGNRLMSNPAYAKKWREDAAAANFRA